MEDFQKLIFVIYKNGIEAINRLTDEELENLFGD